jgi:putative ABC transport system permease protein
MVLLSHRLWATRFGGGPRIVGSPIRIDGELYTVIGVMPASATPHFCETRCGGR